MQFLPGTRCVSGESLESLCWSQCKCVSQTRCALTMMCFSNIIYWWCVVCFAHTQIFASELFSEVSSVARLAQAVFKSTLLLAGPNLFVCLRLLFYRKFITLIYNIHICIYIHHSSFHQNLTKWLGRNNCNRWRCIFPVRPPLLLLLLPSPGVATSAYATPPPPSNTVLPLSLTLLSA